MTGRYGVRPGSLRRVIDARGSERVNTCEDGGVENALPVGNGHPSIARVVREILIALAVAAVIALLGAPIGLLWRVVAPTVELVKTPYGWYPTAEEPEGFVADDGWFAIIGAGAGLALAIVIWLTLRRSRGPAVLLGLAVGSFACAVFAQWLGHRIGLAEYHRVVHAAVDGAKVHRLPQLRIDGVKLVQPMVAVAGYTLFAAFHYSPTLQAEDLGYEAAQGGEPDHPGAGPVSSGPAGPISLLKAPEQLAPVQRLLFPDATAHVPPGDG